MINSSYTPNSADGRRFVVMFRDETMSTWEPLPATMINYVPFALEARSLGGFNASNLFRVEDGGEPQAVSALTPADVTELRALLDGTSTRYMPRSTGSGATLPTYSGGGAPVSPQLGSIWFDSDDGSIKFYDGTTVITLGPGGGGGVTSITAGAGLTGGTITSTGTIALEDIGTPGTYYKVTTDSKGRVISGSTSLTEADLPSLTTPGLISGSVITSGTIGGSTSINTTGSVTSASISTQTFDLLDSDKSNYIRFQTPPTNDLTTSYTLTWPTSAGTSGQVLTTDGTGQLSWSSGVAPSGNAGGDLSGTYPNPELATLHAGGTGTKITYDVKGRVTGSSSLAASDIPSLDWSKISTGKPTTVDGYGITDAVKNAGGIVSIQAGDDASKPAAGTAGRIFVATDTQKIYRDDGVSWIVVASVDAGGGGGSVTEVTVSGAPLSVSNGTTTPQISISQAGASSSGYLSQSDWNTFNSKLDSSLNAGQIYVGNSSNVATARTPGGDVSMNESGSFTVQKIQGSSVSNTTPVDGQVLKYVGGTTNEWQPANFSIGDLKTSGGVQQFANATCTSSQTLTWNSLTDTFTCSNISGLNASVITAGTLDIARIPTGTTAASVAVGNDSRFPSSACGTGNKMRWDGTAWQCEADATGGVSADSLDFTEFKDAMALDASTDIAVSGANQLSITNTGTGASFRVNDEASDTTPFIIDADGKVGIGVANPSYYLDVAGSTDAPLRVRDSTGRNYITTTTRTGTFATVPIVSLGDGRLIIDSTSPDGWNDTILRRSVNDLEIRESDNTTLPGRFVVKQKGGNRAFVVNQDTGGESYFQTNVGIGTTSPRAGLDVNSAIVGKSKSNASTTIDFSTGNLQYTTLNCQAFTLHNLKDGGSYTFAVQGTTSGLCSFTAYSDAGSTSLTVHMPPDHGNTTNGKHTVYTMIVLGSHVYVSWIPGY